jgi:hypothetical protein
MSMLGAADRSIRAGVAVHHTPALDRIHEEARVGSDGAAVQRAELREQVPFIDKLSGSPFLR